MELELELELELEPCELTPVGETDMTEIAASSTTGCIHRCLGPHIPSGGQGIWTVPPSSFPEGLPSQLLQHFLYWHTVFISRQSQVRIRCRGCLHLAVFLQLSSHPAQLFPGSLVPYPNSSVQMDQVREIERLRWETDQHCNRNPGAAAGTGDLGCPRCWTIQESPRPSEGIPTRRQYTLRQYR